LHHRLLSKIIPRIGRKIIGGPSRVHVSCLGAIIKEHGNIVTCLGHDGCEVPH